MIGHIFEGRKFVGPDDRLKWDIEEQEESRIYMWSNKVADDIIY